MTSNANYEYINEAGIDHGLKCTICKRPLQDPLCAPSPCDHTFCRDCITKWTSNGNEKCPECTQQLASVSDLVPAPGIVRDMLNRLLVKCIFCGQTGLKRGNFSDHASTACSKVHIPCPSADIKCPWKGPRDQLNDHVATCVFQPFRTILTELMTKNVQLEDRINQQNVQNQQQDAKIKQQGAQIQQQDARIQQQDARIQHQDAQLKQQGAQIQQQGAQIQQQNARIQQQDAQIQQQGAEIKQHDAQLKQQGAQIQQQGAQIQQQNARIQQQDAQIQQQGAEIKQHDAQLKQQGAQIKQLDAQISK